MGGLVGGALGLAGSVIGLGKSTGGNQNQINSQLFLANQPRYTGYSGINTSPQGYGRNNGKITIDPTIQALRMQSLQNLPGYRNTLGGAYGDYSNTLGGIQSSLMSNDNPYMQARVDPLLEQQAQGRAQLSQGAMRRGIFGDLYANTLANYDTTTGRGIADQRALATNDNLKAMLGVSGSQYGAATDYIHQLQGLDTQQQGIAGSQLAQELAALGLAKPDISSAISAAGFNNQVSQQNQNLFGNSLSGLGAGLAMFL